MICREGTILVGFFFTLLVVVLCFNFWYVIFLVDVHSLPVSLSLSLTRSKILGDCLFVLIEIQVLDSVILLLLSFGSKFLLIGALFMAYHTNSK